MSRVEGVVKTVKDGAKGILGDLEGKLKQYAAQSEASIVAKYASVETSFIEPKAFPSVAPRAAQGFDENVLKNAELIAANAAIEDTSSLTQNDIRYAGLGEYDPKEKAATQAVYATMNIRDNLMKGTISQEQAQLALDNLTKNQIGSDGYLTSTPLDHETARLVNEKVAQHLEFWGTDKSNIVAFVPDKEKEAYQAMHNQFNALSASVTPRSSRDV